MSTEIDRLAEKLAECDEKSKLLREYRAKIEARLVELVGAKTEGSKTTNGMVYKIKTTRRVNRRINEERFLAFKSKIPRTALRNAIRVKHELNLKEYRNLSPEARDAVDEVLDISESKISVSVVKLEE